jgi:hypothetical protein
MKLLEIYKPQYKLYCDLDGVLADFDKRFEYFSSLKPSEYEKKYGTEKFWDLIDNKIGVQFWENIPWMPEGRELWKYIKKYNPIILSSPSRSNTSRLGKKHWVKNNIPDTELILSYAKNKPNYATDDSILIDDRADTIQKWKERGGIGILFRSTYQTINDLRKLGL